MTRKQDNFAILTRIDPQTLSRKSANLNQNLLFYHHYRLLINTYFSMAEFGAFVSRISQNLKVETWPFEIL